MMCSIFRLGLKMGVENRCWTSSPRRTQIHLRQPANREPNPALRIGKSTTRWRKYEGGDDHHLNGNQPQNLQGQKALRLGWEDAFCLGLNLYRGKFEQELKSPYFPLRSTMTPTLHTRYRSSWTVSPLILVVITAPSFTNSSRNGEHRPDKRGRLQFLPVLSDRFTRTHIGPHYKNCRRRRSDTGLRCFALLMTAF